jgi:hypothetical protein
MRCISLYEFFFLIHEGSHYLFPSPGSHVPAVVLQKYFVAYIVCAKEASSIFATYCKEISIRVSVHQLI